MANRQQLRDSYISLGWKVQPVEDWRLVSKVEDLLKFDVNVASPEGQIGTAQVIVSDLDGIAETAEPQGFWKQKDVTFIEALRTWLVTVEQTPGIFAVQVDSTNELDKTAIVSAFIEITVDTVIKAQRKNFIVKNRNNTFSFLELT